MFVPLSPLPVGTKTAGKGALSRRAFGSLIYVKKKLD